LRDLGVRPGDRAEPARRVPGIDVGVLEQQHPDAFVGAAARHHDQTAIGLCEPQAGVGDKLADGCGAGGKVAQPAVVAHLHELAVLVGASLERRVGHLLARAEAVFAEPVADGDGR
jgi:hypothetical protein